MEYERFIFYGSFRKTIDALPEQLGNKVLRAVMNYGTAYELPEVNAADPESGIVYAIMQSIIPNLEKQKTNYENASKGGRPLSVSQEDFDTLFDSGLSNVQIADRLGCSTKTVERRKKIWKEKKKIDTDIETDKDKEKDTVGFDGFVCCMRYNDNKQLLEELTIKYPVLSENGKLLTNQLYEELDYSYVNSQEDYLDNIVNKYKKKITEYMNEAADQLLLVQ